MMHASSAVRHSVTRASLSVVASMDHAPLALAACRSAASTAAAAGSTAGAAAAVASKGDGRRSAAFQTVCALRGRSAGTGAMPASRICSTAASHAAFALLSPRNAASLRAAASKDAHCHPCEPLQQKCPVRTYPACSSRLLCLTPSTEARADVPSAVSCAALGASAVPWPGSCTHLQCPSHRPGSSSPLARALPSRMAASIHASPRYRGEAASASDASSSLCRWLKSHCRGSCRHPHL